MDHVHKFMDACAAKVQKDLDAYAKACKEYFEWCDDAAKNTGFEIESAKASKKKLEANICHLSSDVSTGTSKIEDLTESISAANKELGEAIALREKEEAGCLD